MAKQKSQKNKQKRVKPELAGGFRDCAPAGAIIKQRLLEKIKKTFEDFGFDPLETPAVERTEVLLGGERESDKIIFRVAPAARSEVKDIKRDQLSLRFDLTVPLARFVAANPDIPKPFKRYQVGNVWRGESPQAGRWREFTQADADIVGSSSTDADCEIVCLVYQTFKNLGINNFLIKINNRKILNALPRYAGFTEKKLWELLRLIDKKDKVGEEKTKKEIKKLLGAKAAEKIYKFLAVSGDTKTKILNARELLKGVPAAEGGLKEIIEIFRGLNAFRVDPKNWEIDFSTVRGLGYYTGPIFEVVLTNVPEIGSVAAGGRYDNITIPFTGQKIPTVGISIGVDRLLAALDKIGLLKKKNTTVQALIMNLSSDLKTNYFSLAAELRNANINTEFYLGDDKAFQAQLAYAVKKEIPYVIIYGEEEQKKGVAAVKNLITREQKEIPLNGITEYFKK